MIHYRGLQITATKMGTMEKFELTVYGCLWKSVHLFVEVIQGELFYLSTPNLRKEMEMEDYGCYVPCDGGHPEIGL